MNYSERSPVTREPSTALTTERIAVPGDGSTLDRGGTNEALAAMHGASFRGVRDLANLEFGLFMMTPGQSGNPLSRHARDFLTRWRDGAMLLAHEPVTVAGTVQAGAMSGTTKMVRDEDFIEGVLTRRCFAWLIDMLLISVIFAALWTVLFVFGLLTLGLGFAAMAVLPAVPFLYHFLSLLRYASATPGQVLLGLTVRRDADLGPPTGLQALIFTVVFYLTLATSGLLLLVALFTVRHRTLHDLASDLVVVRRRSFDAWSGQSR